MGCFAVPAAAAVVHKIIRKKNPKWDSKNQKILNHLFIGGAVFGIVDHAWNGELFMIGPNFMMDMALGVAITAAIVFVWKGITWFDALHEKVRAKA